MSDDADHTDDAGEPPVATDVPVIRIERGGPKQDFAVSGSQFDRDDFPRAIEQFGVYDELATPEQLAARHEGVYDPRPASGNKVRTLVHLRCFECGILLGDVDEYDKRVLYHSITEKRWSMSPGGFKCRDCFGPLEPFGYVIAAIDLAIDQAKAKGKPKTLKIGRLPKKR